MLMIRMVLSWYVSLYSEDFGGDVVATVDEGLYLAKVRDKEEENCKSTKAPELKKNAKFKGLPVKSNSKKPELIEMIVRDVCDSLS